MTDIVSPEKRSLMMSGIKGKNTNPELKIRSLLHRMGFRFKLHDKKLPGRPDLVLPKYKAIIFIHGCFWHGHNCSLFKVPSSNAEFWSNKISGNKSRDFRHIENLNKDGWKVLTVWECSLRGKRRLPDEIISHICKNWISAGAENQEISEK